MELLFGTRVRVREKRAVGIWGLGLEGSKESIEKGREAKGQKERENKRNKIKEKKRKQKKKRAAFEFGTGTDRHGWCVRPCPSPGTGTSMHGPVKHMSERVCS